MRETQGSWFCGRQALDALVATDPYGRMGSLGLSLSLNNAEPCRLNHSRSALADVLGLCGL